MSSKGTCDMHRDCTLPLAYVDSKGFAYCDKHGVQRKASGVPCRKLRQIDVARIEAGQPIKWSTR